MASVVLGAAEIALSLSDTVSDKEPDGSFQGRKTTHWSYKLFVAGTIIGVISTVASWILSFHALVISGALLAVSNGCAALYVKKFRVLKSLESHTGRLAEKVQDLRDINKGLECVNSGLQKIPEQWKEEIQKGKQEIERKTRELKKVTAKLEATEVKLQKLAGVTTNIHKKTGELSAEVVKFSQENHLFGERVERLALGANEVKQQHESLAQLIMETDTNAEEYGELNMRFFRQLEMLDDLFALMKDLYVKALQRMRELQSQVNKFGAVVPEATKSVEEAKGVQGEMEDLQNNYKKILEKLERALDKVKRYKKYKAAYRELKALKKNEKETHSDDTTHKI